MANDKGVSGLDDLSLFLEVCKARGFRAAAKRLGLSPASVSDRIMKLEARVGVPLLVRTTRSVMVTEAGQTLAGRLTPLFQDISAALDDATSSRHEIRGLLRINVTGAVMVDILPPLLEVFLASHPEIRIEIVVDDRLVDIIAAGCEAGIRYGEHLAQDMIAVPIGPNRQRVGLAAAPAYLEVHGVPQHPRDLLNHECIRLRYSSGALIAWEFERADEAVTVDPPGRLTIGVDGVAAAIELACAGLGVIYTFENFLTPYMRSKRLVPIMPEWQLEFDGPQLYFPSRFMSAPLRAFVDFVATDRFLEGGSDSRRIESGRIEGAAGHVLRKPLLEPQ